MAFSDYKDLLPSTRVVRMSDLSKASSSQKKDSAPEQNMSMEERAAQYMAMMSGQKPQASAKARAVPDAQQTVQAAPAQQEQSEALKETFSKAKSDAAPDAAALKSTKKAPKRKSDATAHDAPKATKSKRAKHQAEPELPAADAAEEDLVAQMGQFLDMPTEDEPIAASVVTDDYGEHVDAQEPVAAASASAAAEPAAAADAAGRAARGDDELDFGDILEAYAEFHGDNEDDEVVSSLKGKDLSDGPGVPLLDPYRRYYPGVRATDSTVGSDDDVPPWEQGLPEELRAFVRNKGDEEEYTGPKYTELENKRAQEALIEHDRLSAEGKRRLDMLESTAQWNVDGNSRRPSTGIKYTRNSYMKPRGAEEREYYSGPRRDFGEALKEILSRTGVHVSRIEDRNFQKLCFMETSDGERFKLSVFYNKSELVSFVQTSCEHDEAKEVFYLLKNLVGSSIHNIQLKSDEEAAAYQQQSERASSKLLQRNKHLNLVDEDKAKQAVQNNKLNAQGSVDAGMATVIPFAKRLTDILRPLGFKVGAIEDKNYQKQVELTSPSGNKLKLSVFYKGNDKISSFKFNKMPVDDMEVLKLCLQSFEAQLLNTTLDLFKQKSLKRTLHKRN